MNYEIPKCFYYGIVLGICSSLPYENNRTQTALRYNTLSALKVKNLIKVTTGVRRCGKSTLMTQFQDLLRKGNGKVSILAINMDMPEFRFLAVPQRHFLKACFQPVCNIHLVV